MVEAVALVVRPLQVRQEAEALVYLVLEGTLLAIRQERQAVMAD
jgi:hypothetical protein